MEPGPDAGDPACTRLLTRLPARVLDRTRAPLDVAGAAAWGDPAIVLRCGVPPLGPTSDGCLEVDDVEWIFSEDGDGYRFTSYGRTPAVEVQVPASVERTSAPGALPPLAPAVKSLTLSRRCPG